MFLWCMLWRLIAAVLVSTTYVPDEYFQSVEVAYHAVHGHGIVTWEWEDGFRIRSFLSILPFAAYFKLLQVCGIHSQWMYAVGPRFIQAIAVAISDSCLYHVSMAAWGGRQDVEKKRGIGYDSGLWTLLLQCSNWYSMYSATRTMANTTETFIYIMVLYMWYSLAESVPTSRYREWLAMCLMCLQSYARPTSVLLFVPIIVAHVVENRHKASELFRFAVACTLSGSLCAILGILVDSLFYNEAWSISPLNFLYFNVYKKVSSLFGTQSGYWNFVVGLPTALGLTFPLLGSSLWLLLKEKTLLLTHKVLLQAVTALVVFPLGLHCFSYHQELRFLSPVLPAAHIVLGSGIALWTVRAGKDKYQSRRTIAALLLGAIALVHSIGAVYLLVRHQGGPERAARQVALMAASSSKQQFSVMLLAPCYAFPGYSFMHTPPHVQMRLVEPEKCSPFEEKSDSSLFEESPLTYYFRLSAKAGADAVLTFDAYSEKDEGQGKTLEQALLRDGYLLQETFHHADFRYDYDSAFAPKKVLLYRRH